MDLSELADELNTDLVSAAEGLDRGPAAPSFALTSNLFLVRKAKAADQAQRRGIKSQIKAENAACVVTHLPAPGDCTHCVLRGDFVLCDLIPAILAAKGPALDVHITTLGLSTTNATTLAELKERGRVQSLTVVCSHYFQQVDKATTYREVATRLEGLARLVVARSHAKVICLPTAAGDAFVIEGSANLRSSDNLEQMVIFNDRETLAFHRTWIEELASRHG